MRELCFSRSSSDSKEGSGAYQAAGVKQNYKSVYIKKVDGEEIRVIIFKVRKLGLRVRLTQNTLDFEEN